MIETGILKRDGYYDIFINGLRVGSRVDYNQALDYLETWKKAVRVPVQLSLNFD